MQPLPAHRYPVCDACVTSLDPIVGPVCAVCGLPLVSERVVCTRCRGRSFFFDRHVSVFVYRGLARELLYQYKFAGRRRIAVLLAELLAGKIRGEFGSEPWLVPVPPRPGYRRRLGWEHVGELVRVLEREHGLRVAQMLRRRGRAQQKGLDYELRMRHLAGSIVPRAHPPKRGPGPGAELIVVDDVFTTGATMSECARVLRREGAAAVHGVSVAIDE